MRCPHCGKKLDDAVKQCPVCGSPIVQTDNDDRNNQSDKPIRMYQDEPFSYPQNQSSGNSDEPLPLMHKSERTHKGKGKLIAFIAGILVIAVAAIVINLILNNHIDVDLYELNGHYYKAFNNPDEMDYDECRSACEKMGGHLVSINSQDEQNLIMKMIGEKDNYWIGLELHGSEWKWVDSSSFEYTHWDKYQNYDHKEHWQPDNLNGREDVGRIAGRSVDYEAWRMYKGGWLDTNRHGEGEDLSTYGYICEWDSNPDKSNITEK